jgi:hypothetical protein
MKTFYFIPLIFLTACSSTPRLALQPQQPPPAADKSTVRYPEVVRAYHFGRYVDPNDDLVMHEQHVGYRVEENTRWDLHPGRPNGDASVPVEPSPRDAAFSPLPVNDAVLAEVNAQKLATIQIMVQARTLTSALGQFQAALQQARTNLQETAVLRAAVIQLKKRLDVLETAPTQPSLPSAPNFPTNEPSDSLAP